MTPNSTTPSLDLEPRPVPTSESRDTVVESERRLTAQTAPAVIPLLRPSLPTAYEILPYLEFIDEKHWYSNYGPLVALLEEKLSNRLGCAGPAVVTAASATAGITATLLAFPDSGGFALPFALLDLCGYCACRSRRWPDPIFP